MAKAPVYESPPRAKKWGQPFRWKKSGTRSVLTDAPFEIWEKFYGPTILPAGSPDMKGIALNIESDINDLLGHRRFHSRHTMTIHVNVVAGESLDTAGKARRAYNRRRGTAGRHTGSIMLDQRGRAYEEVENFLEELSDLYKKTTWLVSIAVHIYYDEGEDDLIHIPSFAKVTA